MESRLLTDEVFDSRAIVSDRFGMKLLTNCQDIIEISSGSHATAIGHDDGEVISKTIRRLSKCSFPLTGRKVIHELQCELASIVCNKTTDNKARVFFTSGGTEAVETAFRITSYLQELRGKKGANVIIGRQNSYHGMSLLARNAADHPVHSRVLQPQKETWPKLPEPHCQVCPLEKKMGDCSLDCANILQQIIEEQGKNRISAVIFEPISGSTGGALVPPDGYIRTLSKICRSNEIPLIADETITSFGRTGDSFVTKLLSEVDIIIGGKTLGGGFVPINSVILSSGLCNELYELNANIPLRLTFSAPPAICAFAISAQEYIESKQLMKKVKNNTQIIRNMFLQNESFIKMESSVSLHGQGHLWALNAVALKGKGYILFAETKRIASNNGVELMGGIREYASNDIVHIMLTPIFDAIKSELELGVQLTNELILEALQKVRSGDNY